MKRGTKENPYGSYRRVDCGFEACETCKYTMTFGKLVYCRKTENRIALWETIRWARSNKDESKKCAYCHGCLACKHVTKNLSCNRCVDCLATEELINFEPDKYLLEWEVAHGMRKEKSNESV